MNIYHISDTHGFHDQLILPDNIDIIIHSGDASNSPNAAINVHEIEAFLEWYANLPIPHKIFVAGNHDSSIERYPYMKEKIGDKGITYLENSETQIQNIKIYGSPYTPIYGNWSFMKAQNVINRVWEQIPHDTDILITHGPPYSILDSTENRDRSIDLCGDPALGKMIKKLQPKYHLFGHIHNCKSIINTGIRIINNTTYINSAAVEDGQFNKGIIYHGTPLTL
jgi:Icc-related predicted phosphoesterase